MYSLVVVLFVVVLSCAFVSHAAPKYANVALVDKSGDNLIFRGPEPLEKGVFDYDNLVKAMSNLTQMPTTFFMWDISLLNPKTPNEGKDTDVEKAFFAANPNKGAFVLWTINRSSQSPYKFSPDVIKEKALNLSTVVNDDLPYRMSNLSQSLAEKVAVPRVIYFHSEGGTDRAGEVAACYYMQFLKMTLQQATDYNKALPGGEPDQYCINAQAWYCFYLKYAMNYDLACTLK